MQWRTICSIRSFPSIAPFCSPTPLARRRTNDVKEEGECVCERERGRGRAKRGLKRNRSATVSVMYRWRPPGNIGDRRRAPLLLRVIKRQAALPVSILHADAVNCSTAPWLGALFEQTADAKDSVAKCERQMYVLQRALRANSCATSPPQDAYFRLLAVCKLANCTPHRNCTYRH